MNRSDLVSVMAEKYQDLPRTVVNDMVKRIVGMLKGTLLSGGRVEIRGFGSFTVRSRGARTGRNPRTGEKIAVRERNFVRFKAGKELKWRVNCDVESQTKS